MWVFLILAAVPVVEIALFIQVGAWIGTWPTIAAVLGMALLGGWLIRAQGVGTLRAAQAQMRAGRNPGAALAHGALILVAGLMMVTPGFFTDLIALALMVPALRRALIARIAARMAVVAPQPQAGARVIDGEWTEARPSGWVRAPED